MILPRAFIVTCLLALLTAPAAHAGSTLADGGLKARPRAEAASSPAPRSTASAPGPLEARRLSERLGSLDLDRSEPPRPKALGDRLVVSLDDDALPDFVDDALNVTGQYEARLDVSGGVAGATDWIAVRFPARDLARGLPVRINDVLVGVDDLNGATSWPEIELWLEDAANPLWPRQGATSVVAPPLEAVSAGVEPLPSGSFVPSRFTRLSAQLPGGLDVPADWLTDGAFDDAYERFDQPLDDLVGLWLECEGDDCCQSGGCGFTRGLRIEGNRVVRAAGSAGSTIAVRFADPVVEALRPSVDLDLRVTATVDVSDPLAGPAGVFARALSTDSYYAVVIDPGPSPDEVVALAITPMGPVELGREMLTGDGGARALSVEVTGVNPEVQLSVEVDGGSHGPFFDATYRWAGSFAGLVAANAGSEGESWDDFRVERRPDVFVTLRLPEGEDVGLPLDVSNGSLASRSILTSSDGANWAPRPPYDPAFCFNPGNPFVQLQVEEITTQSLLFENESRIVKLGLDCPTCPLTRNRCNENASADERFLPLPTVGEAVGVRVGWWNEHLGDDRLLLRTSVFDANCDSAGSLVASSTLVAGDVTGQLAGGAGLQSLAGVLDFTPLMEGSYCVVVEEFHDSNADCCPDGLEATGPFDDPLGGAACPGACTPTAGSDSNPSTTVVLRDFQVYPACVPNAGPSDLGGASLRLTKGSGNDALVTDLLLIDDTRTTYNVHAMTAQPFEANQCFEGFAPIVDRFAFSGPVGNEVRRTYELPAPPDGRVLWLAAFETDACPAARSLQDSSATDPLLGTCSP